MYAVLSVSGASRLVAENAYDEDYVEYPFT